MRAGFIRTKVGGTQMPHLGKRGRKRKSAALEADEQEPEPEPEVARVIEAPKPWRAPVARMI